MIVDDAPGSIVVSVAGLTHVGLQRDVNEDAFAYARIGGERRLGPEGARDRYVLEGGCVLGVYDGLSGFGDGRTASATAARAVHATLDEPPLPASEDDLRDRLARAVVAANRALTEALRQDPRLRGTGSTATVAALVDACVVIAHVGDSRGYLLRGRRLVPITRDDRLTPELLREASPDVTEEALASLPRNIITKALGMADAVVPSIVRLALRRGDVLLLCTDGLWGMVSDQTIRATLLRQRDPGVAGRVLCDEALRAGGHDNLAVVVARFDGEGLRPPIRAETLAV